MFKRKLISAIAAASIAAGTVSFNVSAADPCHTVRIYDIYGTLMETRIIADGDALDLSGIDTDKMTSHKDDYTQIGFSSWSAFPDKIISDTDVHALYVEMQISCASDPKRTEYFSPKGNIRMDGLHVNITVRTQTPAKDNSGEFIVKEEIVPIESKCTASPATLDEAFAGGKTTATVSIYPPNSRRAITSYDISYYANLGDVNTDGQVNSSDASVILTIYADISTGASPLLPKSFSDRCDVDRNGMIDARDASYVLIYYSMLSTGNEEVQWDDIVNY